MNILTEKEIAHIAGAESRNVMEFARAIESAVLAKLAGRELPEAETHFHLNRYGSSFIHEQVIPEAKNEIGIFPLYTAAQLHQAFAQGAASQLSAEPVGTVSAGTFVHWKDEAVPLMGTSLYTLKSSK